MKKIFLIFLILVLISSGVIIYLNKVILPAKIKSLITSGLQEATQKKVSLESLQFNIFKGLVLKNLIIYDGAKPMVSVEEGSCTVLILPIFTKRIILPTITFKSPVIFLERRANGTFNLLDLFPRKSLTVHKEKLGIFVYKIRIIDGRLDFEDDTIKPLLTKNIVNLNLTLNLSLPASVKFNLKADISAQPAIKIGASGEFKIPKKQFSAKIEIKDLSPREFSSYYEGLGISLSEGLLNTLIEVGFKDNILSLDLNAQTKELVLRKEKISSQLNSTIAAELRYNLKGRQLIYSGKAVLSNSSILGLEPLGNISGISAELSFNNSGLSAQNLSANVLGIPIEAKLALNDFKNPLLNIEAVSGLKLDAVQSILKDKFNFILPADIQGDARLSFILEKKLASAQPAQISGSLDILNAILKPAKLNSPIEGIRGRLDFNQNQVKWSGLNFQYSGIPYQASGMLTNFQAPAVQLKLTSQDLNLESFFNIRDNLIALTKCSGQYLNSGFSLSGNINTVNPPKLEADIKGVADIDLKDAKNIFLQSKDQLEKMKLDGSLRSDFNLNGDINDFKSCFIQAKLTSPYISAYGLKSSGLSLDYNQSEGLAQIPLASLSLYDGTVRLNAKMNLDSEGFPYWVNLDVQGLKIEQLKMDTPARVKDIAGAIQAQVKLNGFSKYSEKLSGTGNIFISEGRLWQLDLFKGLGELLFTSNFANIVFNEGSCAFIIQDKAIFTDSLQLKSNFVDLAGSGRINFDGSIDGSINVQVNDENAPITGTLKDIATVIVGQAGKFGVIKISGTLKEPKYSFKPAVGDILKSLKDVIFGAPSQ
jgi:uncharacterized protein involved in outer membrane biogenesis